MGKSKRPVYVDYSKNGRNYLDPISSSKNVAAKFSSEVQLGLRSYLGIDADVVVYKSKSIFSGFVDYYSTITIKSVKSDSDWIKDIYSYQSNYNFTPSEKKRVSASISGAVKIRRFIINELRSKSNKRTIEFTRYPSGFSTKGSRAYANGQFGSPRVYWEDFLGRRHRYDQKDHMLTKTWNGFWIWVHEIMHYATGRHVPDTRAETNSKNPNTVPDLVNYVRSVWGLPLRIDPFTSRSSSVPGVVYIHFEGSRTVSYHPNPLEPLVPSVVKPPKRGDALPSVPDNPSDPYPGPTSPSRVKYAKARIKRGINEPYTAFEVIKDWMQGKGSNGLPDSLSSGWRMSELSSLVEKAFFDSQMKKHLKKGFRGFRATGFDKNSTFGSFESPDGTILNNGYNKKPSGSFGGWDFPSDSFFGNSFHDRDNSNGNTAPEPDAPSGLPENSGDYSGMIAEMAEQHAKDWNDMSSEEKQSHFAFWDNVWKAVGDFFGGLASSTEAYFKSKFKGNKNPINATSRREKQKEKQNGGVPNLPAYGPGGYGIRRRLRGRTVHPDMADEFLDFGPAKESDKEKKEGIEKILRRRGEAETSEGTFSTLPDMNPNGLLSRTLGPLIRPAGPFEDDQNGYLSQSERLEKFKEFTNSSNVIKFTNPNEVEPEKIPLTPEKMPDDISPRARPGRTSKTRQEIR